MRYFNFSNKLSGSVEETISSRRRKPVTFVNLIKNGIVQRFVAPSFDDGKDAVNLWITEEKVSENLKTRNEPDYRHICSIDDIKKVENGYKVCVDDFSVTFPYLWQASLIHETIAIIMVKGIPMPDFVPEVGVYENRLESWARGFHDWQEIFTFVVSNEK